MIECQILQNDKLIMVRAFRNPSLSLEEVVRKMESYMKEEMFDSKSESVIRVRFSQNIVDTNIDLSDYKSNFIPKV